MPPKSCCQTLTNRDKKCYRPSDKKLFTLKRRFSKQQCLTGPVRGFTMRSSCAPFKDCTKKGGGVSRKKISRRSAVCVLHANPSRVSGTVSFLETSRGLKISYNIKGLKDGLHGFHIHEYGDLTDQCLSACAHFNPCGKTHGGRNSTNRHLGDLGNLVSKNGISKGFLYDKCLKINPSHPHSIIGRSVIVHDQADDLGLGGDSESLKTGNAGSRLACGVIGLAKSIKN